MKTGIWIALCAVCAACVGGGASGPAAGGAAQTGAQDSAAASADGAAVTDTTATGDTTVQDGGVAPDGPAVDESDTAAADVAGVDADDAAAEIAKPVAKPTLAFTSPKPGAKFAVGATVDIALQGTVDPVAVTKASLACSIDGKEGLCAGLGLTFGGGDPIPVTVQLAVVAELPGAHSLTAALDDGLGGVAKAELTFTVNGKPSAPGMDLQPKTPTVLDDIVAVQTQAAVDPDGDKLTVKTTWQVNGADSGVTGDTFGKGKAKKGDTVTAVAVATDSEGNASEPGKAEVKIANAAPGKASVAVGAAKAGFKDKLSAKIVVAATDPDGDELAYTYSWTVDGQVLAGQTAPTLDLATATWPAGQPKNGAVVQIGCTVSDGGATTPCATTGAGAVLQDGDPCGATPAPCATDASCANADGKAVCTCKPGFVGDGKACVDTDECKASTGTCDKNAVCANTPGSFTCTCAKGYSGDGKLCSDVDECKASPPPCDKNAICTNSPGTFGCACNKGFTGDGKLCSDVNECATNNGGCGDPAVFACVDQPAGATPVCGQPKGPNLNEGDLIVTEIMANPAKVADEVGEWVEIRNTTAQSIALAGIVVRSGLTQQYVITGSATLGAGQFLVIGASADGAQNGGIPVGLSWAVTPVAGQISLANNADDVWLTSNGKTLDKVAYDIAKGWPNVNGASMQLTATKLTALANDTPDNWCASAAAFATGSDKASPTKANATCPLDADKDGIDDPVDNCPSIANVDQKDGDGDKKGDLCDNCVAVINADQGDADDDKIGDKCDNCPATANADQKDGDGDKIGDACDPNPGPVCGNSTIEPPETCDDGNQKPGDGCGADCKKEVVGGSVSVGDLVVSEIMANGNGGNGDLGEWFEISNVSNKNLDLNGLSITGKSSDTPIVVSVSIPIKPGQALVFAPSSDVTKNGGHTPAVTYTQSKFPLANDADTITINLGTTVIDTVSYDTSSAGKWPFVTAGKALQLSASKLDAGANDAKDNWCYAGKTFGGLGDLGSPSAPNAVCAPPPVSKPASVWQWLGWFWAWFAG